MAATETEGRAAMPGAEGSRPPLEHAGSTYPPVSESPSEPKSKGVAVVLAVLLAFWTWLYTYKVNAAKFWAGLALTVLGIFLWTAFIGLPILLAVWFWAVIDTASHSRRWFAHYPNVPSQAG